MEKQEAIEILKKVSAHTPGTIIDETWIDNLIADAKTNILNPKDISIKIVFALMELTGAEIVSDIFNKGFEGMSVEELIQDYLSPSIEDEEVIVEMDEFLCQHDLKDKFKNWLIARYPNNDTVMEILNKIAESGDQ